MGNLRFVLVKVYAKPWIALAVFAGCFLAAGPGGGMRLTSPSFHDGGKIPEKFSRTGGNVSPALTVAHIPANAKTLALMVEDPDAPGGLFTHWLVWNIDPKTSGIAEGRAPEGAAEGTNDFGERGYGGPQPPSGTHRYVFKIFALNQRLRLSAGAKRVALDHAMKGHVLAQAQLIGSFSAKLRDALSNNDRPMIVSSTMRETKWKIGDRTLDLSSRCLLMGVLNVTPDSFSDGGKFHDAERAITHGLQLAAEGADIIDVGGESTRPGAEEIPADEECARVLPVIERLHEKTEALISIDTSKLEVARRALEAGAVIVNDVTGGRADPGLFALAAEREAGFIIMHMQGNPRTMQIAPHYEDVVAEVADFFRQQFERAIKCGIDPMAIAFDPGIGFGKTLSHNLTLLRHLDRLVVNDRPLVVGLSRKGFLAKIADAEAIADRLAPTVAFTALLRERGANVLRVHDVKENRAALQASEALLAQEP